ncbi:hypothetical protein MRX96_032397 [Rhipicephalus microplus]
MGALRRRRTHKRCLKTSRAPGDPTIDSPHERPRVTETWRRSGAQEHVERVAPPTPSVTSRHAAANRAFPFPPALALRAQPSIKQRLCYALRSQSCGT